MEINLTKIGNSQGVILPKTLITQYGFREKIYLDLTGEGILLTSKPPVRAPRVGWADDARRMVENGHDESLWPEDMSDDFLDEWLGEGPKT